MKVAEGLLEVWAGMAAMLGKDGKGLVVGHGVAIELGGGGGLPEADHAAWGKGLSVCEGVRLGLRRAGRGRRGAAPRGCGERHD